MNTLTPFKRLSTDEDLELRRWARDNYVPFSDIDGNWHPVIQFECALINATSHLTIDE